ncbi:MAG: tetratricopeptide repeat protein [Acidobacteria bacterium]|nr:tetratricopeptide repeat protein [Acidobacteriota bacterium]
MTPRCTCLLAAFLLLCGAALGSAAQTIELTVIGGTVLDEQGEPLSGALLRIHSLDFDHQVETETDKDGRFYYAGFRPGRCRLVLLRESRVLWSAVVTLVAGQGELRLTVNLKELRQAAERLQQLDPQLESRRAALLVQREQEERLNEYYSRGARLLDQGDAEGAIAALRAALELEPNRASTHDMLGAAYAAAGRDAEALDAYHRALELEPREAAHHNNLATVLVRRGQLDDALSHLEKAAQFDPDGAATYRFNKGAALLNAGRAQEAVAAFRQAIGHDPGFASAHYFLGAALLRSSPRHPTPDGTERLEPRPGTIEAFKRYLELAPDGPYAPAARDTLKQLGVTPPEPPPPAAAPVEAEA